MIAPVDVEQHDATPAALRRDEGAILPLVLVMMVVSALIVIPLLSYAVTVLRANTVVSENTRDREAAEGAVRVALIDPAGLFADCTAAGVAVAPPAKVIDAVETATTCTVVEEVGPLDLVDDGSSVVLQTPVGAAALQLGAELDDTLAGTRMTSPPVPPYPADARWWTATPTLTDGQIWLPNLPVRPAAERTTSFAMPASFNCTVYLPGYYPDPLSVTTGNVYFASGVYYFEDTVTFGGDAEVIVGYGTSSFDDSECADDIQVSSNLIGEPGTFDIDGGGATFVFGRNGNLVIDNSATSTGLSVKFNQRYSTEENGGRVSIMSVNGDDTAATDHLATNVVSVPRSVVASTDGTAAIGGPGTEYVPSASTFTSEVRKPAAPSALTLEARTTDADPPARSAVVVSWKAPEGNELGGGPITGYQVEWARASGPATRTIGCTTEDVIAPEPGRLGCVVTGLQQGSGLRFFVTMQNEAGWSPETSATVTPSPTAPAVTAPAAPENVVVTPYEDAVHVEWDASASNGAPVTGYTVIVERVFTAAPAAPANDAQPADGADGDDGDDTTTTTSTTVPPALPEQFEEVARCSPGASTTEAAATECTLAIPPFVDDGTTTVNHVVRVVATNSIGPSEEALFTPDPPILAFEGDPAPEPEPLTEARVVPYLPTPILDLRVSKDVTTVVSIPGYVSVPMGRIVVTNPEGHEVRVSGGILASTIEVDDARAAGAESLPIGYKNDIVLQRKVRLAATAGSVTVSAYVQINENGEFRVNSWVVG